MAITDAWPLFGLSVRSGPLELRLPNDHELSQLADVAASGVHDPSVMPFQVPWTRVEPPQLQRNLLQYHWRQRSEWSPESWRCCFAVFHEGKPVGSQSLEASDFADLRTFKTGSWLGLSWQGRGIGKAMRAAVLELVFAHLGAREGYTSAAEDNPASNGVSRSLGYVDNGSKLVRLDEKPRHIFVYRIEREAWMSGPNRPELSVQGLDACHHLFDKNAGATTVDNRE